MGCWMGALGRLTIVPEPDNDLIMEYVDFSKSACPKEYKEDEVFHNSWYFDENNRLASGIGKFAEPSVWYRCLKEEFFEPRGYQLYGDPVFVGEVDLDIWKFGEERYKEQQLWRERVGLLFLNRKERYDGCLYYYSKDERDFMGRVHGTDGYLRI